MKRKLTQDTQSISNVTQAIATQPQSNDASVINNSVDQLTEPPNKKQRINIMKQLFLLLMNDYEELNST